MISQVLPPGTAVVEAFSDIVDASLFAEEEAALSGAACRRRAEFATGRACARAALAELGLPSAALVPGPRGEPRWPAGVTGSITHCTGYRACAVARSSQVAAIGIDAEPNGPLPDGTLAAVAMAAERAWLAEQMAVAPQVCWDRLLFSAKESAYKAWFPLTGRPLQFENVAVVADPAGSRFTARLLVPDVAADRRWPAELEGGWLAGNGLVMTAVVVPA